MSISPRQTFACYSRATIAVLHVPRKRQKIKEALKATNGNLIFQNWLSRGEGAEAAASGAGSCSSH